MIDRQSLSVAIALLCGCASAPQTHYYALALPAVARPAATATAVLSVDELSVAAAYDEQRIVYRRGPFQLDYYEYHQWSAPPSMAISDYVRDALEQSGRFKRVTGERSPNATLVLGGRVSAFEELDITPEQWVGRVDIELVLEDPKTGQVLWSRRFREQRPVPNRHPTGLAQALSAALADIVAKATPEILAVAERAGAAAARSP